MKYHAAGLCRIDSEMWRNGSAAVRGAEPLAVSSLQAECLERGFRGRPLGERVGPHAVGPEGKIFPASEIVPSVGKNGVIGGKKSNPRTSLKLRYPYFIAAEFVLFQSARKVTLPHLLIGITFAVVGVLAFRLGNQLPLWASIFMGLASGIISAWLLFRLFRLVLPLLDKLVAWEVLTPPDLARLENKVASYLGRSDSVDMN